jgi:hypothetical protein
MGIGKIFFGVVLIVIGVAIWFMIQGDALGVFIQSPQDRFNFREAFGQFQFIYFLLTFGLGIGVILWGTQS